MSDLTSAASDTRMPPEVEAQAQTEAALSIPISDKLDPFLVDKLDDNDPNNPKAWSTARKWYITMASGVLVLNATFASSAPSGIAPALIERFNMSEEVATLTISLFVVGYCVGPLIWGPFSEEYGRRPVFIATFFLYMVFQMGTALAQNKATILVLRFLGGTFAACPLTNTGAVISDIWDAKGRGRAMAIFALAPNAGPALGPIVSGFIQVSNASWRWLFWVLAIFACACWVMIIFTMPETYMPILLVRRAKQLRKETADNHYYAPMEASKKNICETVESVLTRPFKMLSSEPMLLAISLYMGFVYGCTYLLFEAYPIVFAKGHHLNPGVSGLMFLPVFFGALIAVVVYALIFGPRYEREVEKCGSNSVDPEFRLEITIVGAPLYTIAFFWFAWTSYPSVSPWAPMISGLLNGFGFIWIFLGLFNYLIDTYLAFAASALAAAAVLRSFFGAAFPLFARQMYNALNPRWASTLLGFIALVMTPIPFVFLKCGGQLRKRSKFLPPAPLLPSR